MKNITITKELFLETMRALETQREIDNKCHEAFKVILPHDYVTGYDNDILESQLVKLLQVCTEDSEEESWIYYYMYELNFGKEYKDGCVKVHKKNVKLATPEDLWNLLNLEY